MSPATKRSTRSSTNQVSDATTASQRHVDPNGTESTTSQHEQAMANPQGQGQEEEMDQLNENQYQNVENQHLQAGAGPGPGVQNVDSHPHYYQPRPDGNVHESPNPNQAAAQASHSHHYGQPLGTLEPSADRYQLQSGNGRRGSTDPMLHASIVAAATANAAANGGERRPPMNSYNGYEDPNSYYPHYPPQQSYNAQGPSNYPMMPHPSEQQHHHPMNHQQHHQQHVPPPPPHYQPQLTDMTGTTSSSSSSQHGGEDESTHGGGGVARRSNGAPPGTNNHPGLGRKETPYSRSPELRVTHASAERKRRKDMKDLFDELRSLLPTDKGPKSSKWEILTRALETIKAHSESEANLKAEVEQLKNQLAAYQGNTADYGNAGHSHSHEGSAAAYQPQGAPTYPTS